jgi:hypothetical protein
MTGESRELLLRHCKDRTPVHEALERAQRNEIDGVAVYSFQCDVQQATELLEVAKNLPTAVKDMAHAIFAAMAG